LAPEALNNARCLRRLAAALCVLAAGLSLAPLAAIAARKVHLIPHGARPHFPEARPVPYPRLEWPLEIGGSQYAPLAWNDIAGWSEDELRNFTGSLNLPAVLGDDARHAVLAGTPRRAMGLTECADALLAVVREWPSGASPVP